MDREYAALSRVILIRLGLFGLPAGMLAAYLWYVGGAAWWGSFLLIPARILIFWTEITFDGREFTYAVPLELGGTSALVYQINQLNLTFLEIVTLFAAWRHTSAKAAFKLLGWCVLWLVLYHVFSLFIQCYSLEIGPDFANQQHIMWESSWWFRVIKNVAAFDKFLLRFWAGFPVFGLALVLSLFTFKAKRKKL